MELFDQFLEYGYFTLYAVTLAVALWRYPRYFDTVFKYFPILLMYTFITELAGYIIKVYNEFDLVLTDQLDYNNWIVYNVYDIVFYIYFYYVYYSTIKNNRYKKAILIGAGIFAIAAIINPFTADFTSELQISSYTIGALILIMSILLYFNYIKSISDSWFNNNNLLCWLSIGILIFYVGYLPIIFLSRFQIVVGEEYLILRRLHLILIIIMYSCFIIGFIKLRRRSLT